MPDALHPIYVRVPNNGITRNDRGREFSFSPINFRYGRCRVDALVGREIIHRQTTLWTLYSSVFQTTCRSQEEDFAFVYAPP